MAEASIDLARTPLAVRTGSPLLRRGAYYLLLTGAVGGAYLGAAIVFILLQAGAVIDARAFPVFFTLAVLVLFNPLRRRLEAVVDRMFARTRYDGAQVLAALGAELAATLERERIVTLVREAVERAIPNAGVRLPVGAPGQPPPGVPAPLLRRLAEGRVVSRFDTTAPAEARAALGAVGAEIAVPLEGRDGLLGVLTVGPKRSGLGYSPGDAEFLRALANQAVSSLENARSYEALVALNARLEARVRERTGQLESANRELAEAYVELKNAEVQLVQSEKMASLGRLVAGVAHEINNPVAFISSSVAPLRRRLEVAAAGAPAEVATLLAEASEIVAVMARGAERTAAIVTDLRTFSRLGEATRKPVDLREGLEVSLRLLESRWRGRIAVHRDYGALPPVECDAGQMNQVFMNVLANACDAIPESGNLWITTRAEDGTVRVVIRDDGVGMAPDVIGRIFEPFFTTKDVGGGTGLGLAISQGVVAAHGGRIEVESAPGRGATFQIVLPVAPGAVALDSVAAGR